MFDLKKLEALLDSIEKEQAAQDVEGKFHPVLSKPWPRRGVYAMGLVDPALDRMMDKYDIFRNDSYQNLGTSEFPIWGKPMAELSIAMLQAAYGRSSFFGGSNMLAPMMYGSWPMDNGAPTPVQDPAETPYGKLRKRIKQLREVTPEKIANPNPTPVQPERSPDYVHTLTAWRGWDVEDGKLVGVGNNFEWTPKMVNKAHCMCENHTAPQMKCNCGFWSFKTMDLMTRALEPHVRNVHVIGTVEIWGRVIECENGFRSEYAYPKELWLTKDGLESLSWVYGVPVRKLEGA